MISIVTPSYNRAHTLARLYRSILRQSSQALEWIIVDDGSSDDTAELVKTFFGVQVKYFYQENSGKHVAVNKGVELAASDWIFIVDSDDALTVDAIQQVENCLDRLPKSGLVGVCFRKALFHGELVGLKVHYDEGRYLTPTEAGNLLKGDLAYIFRRDTMLKVPFPIIRGEKFVPELYVWNKISDLGKIFFILDSAIYLCDYLQDGYTKNFKLNLKRNPRGFLVYYWSQVSREKNMARKIKCLVRSAQCLIYFVLR